MTSKKIDYPDSIWRLFNGTPCIADSDLKGNRIYQPTEVEPAAYAKIVLNRDEENVSESEAKLAYSLYMHLWNGPNPCGLASHPMAELRDKLRVRSVKAVARSIDILSALGLIHAEVKASQARIWVPDMQGINIVLTSQAHLVKRIAAKMPKCGPAGMAAALTER